MAHGASLFVLVALTHERIPSTHKAYHAYAPHVLDQDNDGLMQTDTNVSVQILQELKYSAYRNTLEHNVQPRCHDDHSD